jgi:hypothetical protein
LSAAILDQFGYSNVLDQLMRRYVEPFSRLLYPHVHTTTAMSSTTNSESKAAKMDVSSDSKLNPLDSHHGFVVEYQKGKDTKL